MSNEHNNAKKDAFLAQQDLLEKIAECGAEAHASTVKFLPHEHRGLHCIDEGTPWGLHSAGSGILLDKEDAIKTFRDAGITEVTSHDGCGAAKLFAKKTGQDESQSDDLGRMWAMELARDLGVPYRHVSFSEMKRPKDFHIARVLYYDGTGKFSVAETEGMPPGFVVSRKIQTRTDSLAEVGVSLGIAFGAHGFGELITEKDPFYLIAVGKDAADVESLKNELFQVSHPYGSKVIVDGFVF